MLDLFLLLLKGKNIGFKFTLFICRTTLAWFRCACIFLLACVDVLYGHQPLSVFLIVVLYLNDFHESMLRVHL